MLFCGSRKNVEKHQAIHVSKRLPLSPDPPIAADLVFGCAFAVEPPHRGERPGAVSRFRRHQGCPEIVEAVAPTDDEVAAGAVARLHSDPSKRPGTRRAPGRMGWLLRESRGS